MHPGEAAVYHRRVVFILRWPRYSLNMRRRVREGGMGVIQMDGRRKERRKRGGGERERSVLL